MKRIITALSFLFIICFSCGYFKFLSEDEFYGIEKSVSGSSGGTLSYTPPSISGTTITGNTGTPIFLQGRNVSLSNFWIAETEVTYAQWYAVYQWAAANGYTFQSPGNRGSCYTNPSGPYFGFPSGHENNPVTAIFWYDVVVWCNAYSEIEGRTFCYNISGNPFKNANDSNKANVTCNWSADGYRLPTEAEWEYAARGGYDATPLNAPWSYIYSGSDTCSSVAVLQTYIGTNDVRSKSANSLGLYDMSGNILEWCWDWHGTIGTITETNPTGPSSGSSRLIRGGGYDRPDSECTVSYRTMMWPDQVFNIEAVGFRVARSNP